MTACSVDSDLDGVLAQTRNLWGDLRGARLFITGGTGFFGCWILESFFKANRELSLGAKAVVLTRDQGSFRKKRPHLSNHPELSFLAGDVRSFDFPKGGFTHIIHAATESNAPRVFDFAAACGAKNLLLTSSGAVYGRQPADMTHIPEDYPGSVEQNAAKPAYAEDKRSAELLGAASSARGLEVKIARGFAFVGPYMPFDGSFAAGNFIRDAVQGRAIEVSGDGTPYRSYLYAADLAIWLWTILLRGKSLRPYNVGSEKRVAIAELADAVKSAVNPNLAVHIAQKPRAGAPPEQYVPSTQRAREELGLRQTVDLPEAVRRTAKWLEKSNA
ncbi:MAG TPA: NAD-dependent epimerase/dehydratase family protein [Elusimicrobiota bacterium]|nr:NAD-dependent epimerase/dehydratase family protein [Elusimicrobiota bacterium]